MKSNSFMPRIIKILILISIISIVVYYLDNRITAHDLRFYSGKDNGFSVRFVSVSVLSSLFFFIISRKNRFKKLILGFFIGLLSNVFSYFVWFYWFDDFGLSFHILASIMFMILFFILEKRPPRRSITSD